MELIQDITSLEALYGTPAAPSLVKVADRVTPEYAAFLKAARFCVLSTVGPDGTDASPRGDDGPVAILLDEKTLALPDRRGNNRIDSLRNIIIDGRVSLMFLVRGSGNAIRVNGKGRLTADSDLCHRFAHDGTLPRSVILIAVEEVYFQCARAVIRAGLWQGVDDSGDLPTPGDILSAQTKGAEGGADYDKTWAARAAKTMW